MQTVLVANRGEIAVRIIRSCKKLGLRSIAVYSENDERSLHVRLADESVCIGPRPADKSYLNIDAILAAAKAYRADLLHPGVGFLSENDTFAEACDEAGIRFIGPAPASMRVLGDKEAARKTMIANGFPVVPGSDGTVDTLKEAVLAAKSIGYPLMIKAAKGGGGKGIRIVEDACALEREFPLVRRTFGLDLIKAQIQVAMGHHIRISQENLIPRGHAIECRINAECPAENFRPSPGVIQRMQLPSGNGVRIDSGYATGDEISPYYDSMVLKLICFADDRDEAIRQSLAALGELTIDGIEHNTELARAMLADPDFRSGNVHTKWIEQTFLPRFLRGRT